MLLTGMLLFVVPFNVAMLRPAVGITFALLAPGYVLLAILFPENCRSADHHKSIGEAGQELPGPERLIFSFGTSVAIVVIVGLFLGASPVGISPETLFVCIGGVTGGGLMFAWRRRLQVPADARLDAAVRRRCTATTHTFVTADTPVETLVNLALIVIIVLAIPTLVIAGASPSDDGLTEMFLLSDDPDGYPGSFGAEQTEGLVVGVGNYEGEPIEYTVVVMLQHTDGSGADVDVLEEVETHRFTVSLEPGEERLIDHFVTPGEHMTGSDIRLVYLLYIDEPPEEPAVETAYRHLHLWVDVGGAADEAASVDDPSRARGESA